MLKLIEELRACEARLLQKRNFCEQAQADLLTAVEQFATVSAGIQHAGQKLFPQDACFAVVTFNLRRTVPEHGLCFHIARGGLEIDGNVKVGEQAVFTRFEVFTKFALGGPFASSTSVILDPPTLTFGEAVRAWCCNLDALSSGLVPVVMHVFPEFFETLQTETL